MVAQFADNWEMSGRKMSTALVFSHWKTGRTAANQAK